MRSATPGRKFCTNTSAPAASSRSSARPASCARFSASERLPRFARWNSPEIPPRDEPTARSTSPAPGGSTLITSAPWSARSVVASGPEITAEQSTMRTPDSGSSIGSSVAIAASIREGHALMSDPVSDLLRFIDRSPTPYHAVAEASRRLAAAGFRALDEGELWELSPGDARYAVRGGGALLALIVGERSPADAGFHWIGAHTDSPNLRVKPVPDLSREGVQQLAMEPYGGVLLHTWLDRDLSLAGRVSIAHESGVATVLVDFRRPLLR